jgi:CDP-glycerol glycerophosphotransferase
VILLFLTIPLKAIGFLIPKSKKVWIFGNHLGEKDNSFYLFRYVQLNCPGIIAIWISKTNEKVSVKTPSAYYYLSLKGIYYQYIAKVSIHTTGLGDFAKFTLANKYRVQLWHGIPIKHILLDSPETTPNFLSLKISRLMLQKLIATKSGHTYDLLIASSDHIKTVLAKAFNQPLHKIAITGYPRHDLIGSKRHSSNGQSHNILYAPTWRADTNKALKIVGEGINLISDAFGNHSSITLCIHPLNSQIKKAFKGTKNLSIYQGDDINKDLTSFDHLVTDYSSIAIDFAFLQRPVSFFTPDLSEYIVNRGVYQEYITLISDHQLTNDNNALIDVDLFFEHSDGLANSRIIERIYTDIRLAS